MLNNISLIGRAVTTIEPRFTIRVLRTLTATRRRLNKDSIKAILNQAYPKGCALHVYTLAACHRADEGVM